MVNWINVLETHLSYTKLKGQTVLEILFYIKQYEGKPENKGEITIFPEHRFYSCTKRIPKKGYI